MRAKSVIRNIVTSLVAGSLFAFGPAFGSSSAFASESLDKESYPASYFLTNIGQATSVKLQSPWTSCWAFAITSALESSILKASAKDVDLAAASDAPQIANLTDSIDISERAISWFAHELQTEASAGNQKDEGYYLVNPDDPKNQLTDGNFEMVLPQLTARQSIVKEDVAPYQFNGYDGSIPWYSTGNGQGSSTDTRTYDWSLDANLRTTEDIGWRVSEIYKLPSPAVLEFNSSYGDYDYVGYHAPGTRAIKGALMDVGAVAIAIDTNAYLPSSIEAGAYKTTAPDLDFTFSTWSQYDGADYILCNHAVTIVGWDDNYSASNFAGTESGSPSGDGAWLCKNNWGSDEFYSSLGHPEDASHWGLEDENGNASGFFWLSYYDHSISTPVAFGVEPIGESYENLYQYDYLGASDYKSPTSYSTDAWVANAFTAESTELIRAISAETFDEDQTIDFKIYRLAPNIDLEATPANELFSKAQLVDEQTVSFEYAGFHRISLESPVLMAKGERFLIAQRLSGITDPEEGTPYQATYLSVEIAYTNNIPGNPQTTMAKVASNPGETFLGFDGEWMSLENYNKMYEESCAENGKSVDAVFGNALIKAYTGSTSMNDDSRVYELVPLN